MHDLASPHDLPTAKPSPDPLRQHLARAAVIVVVLGVLPFALGAAPVWQLLGTLVSLTMVASCVPLVWRAVFSTDPRHIARD